MDKNGMEVRFGGLKCFSREFLSIHLSIFFFRMPWPYDPIFLPSNRCQGSWCFLIDLVVHKPTYCCSPSEVLLYYQPTGMVFASFASCTFILHFPLFPHDLRSLSVYIESCVLQKYTWNWFKSMSLDNKNSFKHNVHSKHQSFPLLYAELTAWL